MTATKMARYAPLTLEEAIEVLNSLPFLACMCSQKLLNNMLDPRSKGRRCVPERPAVYEVEFEVSKNGRKFTFPKQPFRVMREITREEYRAAVPFAAIGGPGSFYYELHTD